jgi:hypothetical protein
VLHRRAFDPLRPVETIDASTFTTNAFATRAPVTGEPIGGSVAGKSTELVWPTTRPPPSGPIRIADGKSDPAPPK